MSAEQLSSDLTEAVLALLWRQWAQLGLSGHAPRESARVAADPEALLLCTLDAGSADPRLFGEALDWWLANKDLVSVHRLRSLARDPLDAALIDGARRWVDAHGRRGTPEPPIDREIDLAALHPALRPGRRGLDPWFRAAGLAVPQVDPSQKSTRPDMIAPISFAFRLRRLLGVGARAEVMRVLLTVRAPRLTAGAITASGGFSKHSVNEALGELTESGLVSRAPVGNQYLYATDVSAWSALLGVGDAGQLPQHRDWIPLLYALRSLARWLNAPPTRELTGYPLASAARTEFERVAPHLELARLGASARPFAAGGAYWEAFEAMTREIIDGVAAI